MITRILGISGVGRFENYAIKGDMALRKSTIVYAENGHGKTTLSNIIKSLSSGNNSLITNRKTIGSDEQKIRIEVGGVVHAFKDGQWKGGGVGNRIEVFDAFLSMKISIRDLNFHSSIVRISISLLLGKKE